MMDGETPNFLEIAAPPISRFIRISRAWASVIFAAFESSPLDPAFRPILLSFLHFAIGRCFHVFPAIILAIVDDRTLNSPAISDPFRPASAPDRMARTCASVSLFVFTDSPRHGLPRPMDSPRPRIICIAPLVACSFRLWQDLQRASRFDGWLAAFVVLKS